MQRMIDCGWWLMLLVCGTCGAVWGLIVGGDMLGHCEECALSHGMVRSADSYQMAPTYQTSFAIKLRQCVSCRTGLHPSDEWCSQLGRA
jgi:hypothetical protein